nr:PREDICTED: tyramine beta-hydroxylase [Bemisia tabaci]
MLQSLFILLLYATRSLAHFHPHVHANQQTHPYTHGKTKTFQVPLDGSSNATLRWALNYPQQKVFLAVRTPLSEKGWFGIGFSDYGELTDADLCFFWIDFKERVHFEDVHTDEEGRIFVDEQNDCLNFDFAREGEDILFFYTRKFDTCDSGDYVIEEGTTHIVWVKGSSPLFKLEGLNVAEAEKSGMQRTQLLKNINADPDLDAGSWPVKILNSQVKVPDVETTYWCTLHKLPEELREKHHIIAYEAVIEPSSEGIVHHMEVFHCVAGPGDEIPDYAGSCSDFERPEKTKVCKKVIAAWAMGATPFFYPKEAGLPIGGPDYNLYVMLEVHYHNPDKRGDVIDSSGIQLTLTSRLRPYDAGVMELGLEYTNKMAIPPQQSYFPLTGFCVPECTAVGIPPEGIIIFGSQLHTHLCGYRIYTRHIRDGRELVEVNRDNHYSPHFQEIRLLKQPAHILPGDALITECIYHTMDRRNITVGGESITDEMCVNYVHYYPAVNLEVCKSSVTLNNLNTFFRSLKEWENQDTSEEKGVVENFNSIEWTPMRARLLDELFKQSTMSFSCNQSNGARFPGDWENLPTVPVPYALPPKPRKCLI